MYGIRIDMTGFNIRGPVSGKVGVSVHVRYLLELLHTNGHPVAIFDFDPGPDGSGQKTNTPTTKHGSILNNLSLRILFFTENYLLLHLSHVQRNSGDCGDLRGLRDTLPYNRNLPKG